MESAGRPQATGTIVEMTSPILDAGSSTGTDSLPGSRWQESASGHAGQISTRRARSTVAAGLG
jgi:hypothetical protein